MSDIFLTQDEGIIISTRLHGENSLIVKIFSKENGLVTAYAKSGYSKKNSPIYQKGNLIRFNIQKKNINGLGFLSADIISSFWVKFAKNRFICTYFNIICDILGKFLCEDTKEDALYNHLIKLIKDFSGDDHFHIGKQFNLFLLHCLSHIGYRPDIFTCCVTGKTESLAFVSPKTGRAVTYEVGKPYKDKLLILPRFLIDNNHNVSCDDINYGFRLMTFFMEKFLYEPKGEVLPEIFISLCKIRPSLMSKTKL